MNLKGAFILGLASFVSAYAVGERFLQCQLYPNGDISLIKYVRNDIANIAYFPVAKAELDLSLTSLKKVTVESRIEDFGIRTSFTIALPDTQTTGGKVQHNTTTSSYFVDPGENAILAMNNADTHAMELVLCHDVVK